MEKQSTLDLEPEAWKYKTDSGYSVTEGMEYEVFTREFRVIHDKIKEQQEQTLKILDTEVFSGNESFKQEEANARQYLFLEGKRESKRQTETETYSMTEVVVGGGILIVLFLLLVRFTFRKKKIVQRRGTTEWKATYR